MCITIFQCHECINCPVDEIKGPKQWNKEVDFKPCPLLKDDDLEPCPKTELQFREDPDIVKDLCDKCRNEVEEEKKNKEKKDRDDREREEAKEKARKELGEMTWGNYNLNKII